MTIADDATDFLNVAAVACPELGYLAVPAGIIEGAFSSGALSQQLTEIQDQIKQMQSEIQTLQSSVKSNADNIAKLYQEMAEHDNAMAVNNYNSNIDEVSVTWKWFGENIIQNVDNNKTKPTGDMVNDWNNYLEGTLSASDIFQAVGSAISANNAVETYSAVNAGVESNLSILLDGGFQTIG